MLENRINPTKAAEDIKDAYLRYLTTSFSLKNPNLAEEFRSQIKLNEQLFRGPILQATPHYNKGKSIKDLISEENSLITDEFLSIEKYIPLERELYSHQEKALRKIKEGKNIVVATGTGSGKTESFLFPIIEHLLEEKKQNKLTAGVRALLVYPMNALANDQIIRLREMLPPESGITFGRYTGQTEKEYKDALEMFKEENAGKLPQQNELISRSQITGNHIENGTYSGPPHILLTNFAMLEFLLMRPADSILFDYNSGNTWKFIVLDEAHTYSGALGTEIGFLMRRLKDRICLSESGKIRCIATSATIGNVKDPDTLTSIVETAEALFGEKFNKEDIINADIIPIETRFEEKFWGKGHSLTYQQIAEVLKKEYLISNQELSEQIIDVFMNSTIGGKPNDDLFQEALVICNDKKSEKDLISNVLHYLLKGDERIFELSKLIEDKTLTINEVANIIFDSVDSEDNKNNLICLIDLATAAKHPISGIPLVSVRYHYFVRSLDGLSVYWEPKNNDKINLKLGKHSKVGESTAYDLHGCKRCGASFLFGYLSSKTGSPYFSSSIIRKKLEEKDLKVNSIYLSIDLEDAVQAPEEEDVLADELPPNEEKEINETLNESLIGEKEYLCVSCGALSSKKESHCSCNNQSLKEVRRVSSSTNGKNLKTCPSCGGQNRRGKIINSFRTNEDSASYILAGALMKHIPETNENNQKLKIIETPVNKFSKKPAERRIEIAKGKRRLLVFSDSRQDAAYFSTYLQKNNDKISHRQLIYKALKSLHEQEPLSNAFSPSVIINQMIIEAKNAFMFKTITDLTEQKMEVSKWLFSELCNIQARQSLEGTGLIHWKLNKEIHEKILDKFIENEEYFRTDFGLTPEELLAIVENLLNYLRNKSVQEPFQNVLSNDIYFWPRNRAYTISKEISNAKISCVSWTPKSSRKNGRSDFIERFLIKKKNFTFNNSKINELINDIWDILNLDDVKLFADENLDILWQGNNLGISFRIKNNIWECSLKHNQEKLPDNISYGWHMCNHCSSLTYINLNNTCPTYRCHGDLESINPDEKLSDNFYRSQYISKTVIPIQVAEHTAQISTKAGAERQKSFTNDETPLNVLSCSTTFELGVDVGQLHSVFLKNVPPTVSNYVQRAGRAARRLDATAFIMTFCRSRSHDLSYFESAEKMVSGKVEPPRVKIDNIDIARRHLQAVVLSRFWKNNLEFFNGRKGGRSGKIDWLFFQEKTISETIFDWLNTRPQDLKKELERVFPNKLNEILMIENWGWVSDFISEYVPSDNSEINELSKWNGTLGLAQTEAISELTEYEKIGNTQPKLYNKTQKHIKRIKEKETLQYLPSRKVLPKYGFPVDVVSLKLQMKDNDWVQELVLERDLKMALSEYAPGCTLIANGKIIKSYALEVVPGREWTNYNYKICGSCGRFRRSTTSNDSAPNKCECGEIDIKKDKNFIIPIYGFKTYLTEEGQEPVEVRPERTYATRVFFSGYREAEQKVFSPEGSINIDSGLKLEKMYNSQGMLVVLNEGKNSKQGFWICSRCGFGEPIDGNKPTSHKTPWGSKCEGYLSPKVLGHEFQSDVLELRFSGTALPINYSEDFWLSLTSAILAGASQELQIEERDIDGTVLNYGGGTYRSIVLFDSVPGGAGYVGKISKKLKQVIYKAWRIANECTECSRDQSCNSCLRSYRNQFAHDLLKRGPVADFLSQLIKSIYSKDENDGFYPLGKIESGKWLESMIINSDNCNLILDIIPKLSENNSIKFGRNWYDILGDSLKRNSKVKLYFKENITNLTNLDNPTQNLTGLIWLLQYPELEIFHIPQSSNLNINMLIKTGDDVFAAKWDNKDNSPILHPRQARIEIKACEVSDYNNFTNDFKKLENLQNTIKFDRSKVIELLTKTEVIRVQQGSRKTWSDWFNNKIEPDFNDIFIHDRYIRKYHQFKSLEKFLDFIDKNSKTYNTKPTVTVSTTYEEQREKETQEDQFQYLTNKYENLNLDKKINSDLTHARSIVFKGNNKGLRVLLDKGFDMFSRDGSTYDTYLVFEKI